MKSITLRIPDSLHTCISSLADEDQVSLNNWMNSALVEKSSSRRTESYIKRRTARGSKEGLIKFLDERVPDVPPIDGDEIVNTHKNQ